MSRYPFEEFTKVAWVPGASGIANPAAPTTAELNAGTDLSCWLTRDGLNLPNTTNGADDSSLCSKQDTMVPGSVGFDPSLKLFRDNGTDTAWNLVNWSDEGWLVVRRGVPVGTAWTSGQKVEVYHGQFGNPSPIPSASNQSQLLEAKLFNRPNTTLKATVA